MHGETTLHIAPEHPAFAGHFPGTPIVPGVVLLDAAIHAAAQLLGVAEPCQVNSAKFLSAVGPGEALTISVDTTASGGAQFEITSGDRKVATGTLAWPPAP
jgi:3-hydroxyacyl-[acyl-carrier-protein] dehydratase